MEDVLGMGDDHELKETESVRKIGKGHLTALSGQRQLLNEQDFYRNEFRVSKRWQVTHTVVLEDALKHSISGKCTICYDSVNGRLVIADNYKIQTLLV